MTIITIELPDEIALRVKQTGVLSNSEYINTLFDEAARHVAAEHLRQTWQSMDKIATPALSDSDLQDCIAAVRAAAARGSDSPKRAS
jgi:hypothetical protein